VDRMLEGMRNSGLMGYGYELVDGGLKHCSRRLG
jgi:hypothetical protein